MLQTQCCLWDTSEPQMMFPSAIPKSTVENLNSGTSPTEANEALLALLLSPVRGMLRRVGGALLVTLSWPGTL